MAAHQSSFGTLKREVRRLKCREHHTLGVLRLAVFCEHAESEGFGLERHQVDFDITLGVFMKAQAGDDYVVFA